MILIWRFGTLRNISRLIFHSKRPTFVLTLILFFLGISIINLRIILVAETSPDRKCRVAAAELFHSILILMIGRTANLGSSDDESQTPLSKIYRKVFPALIRLSGDFDSVPRDLLRPVCVFCLICLQVAFSNHPLAYS
jgi:hypothetical protein